MEYTYKKLTDEETVDDISGADKITVNVNGSVKQATVDKVVDSSELSTRVGKLSSLTTTVKTSIVTAINSLVTALSTHKTSGDHDGRYYTESEIDTKLSSKASTAVATTTTNGLMSASDKTLLGQLTSDFNASVVKGANWETLWDSTMSGGVGIGSAQGVDFDKKGYTVFAFILTAGVIIFGNCPNTDGTTYRFATPGVESINGVITNSTIRIRLDSYKARFYFHDVSCVMGSSSYARGIYGIYGIK